MLSTDRDLRFNLSHSGEFAVFAVARDREVGVDVERVRADADLEVLRLQGVDRASGAKPGGRT